MQLSLCLRLKACQSASFLYNLPFEVTAMPLAQVRLQSTDAKIELSSIRPVQEIKQPKADVSIKQLPAQVTIDTTPSKLSIDQTEAWADMNLKSVFRLTEEAADQGYQDWLSGLARRAQDGDELMRIENGGKPIANQAKRNSEDPTYDFNIGWIPSHFSVKLNYQPAKVNIDVKVNKPEINVYPMDPNIRYEPGKVNVQMKQFSSLKVDFANLKFVGINYEQLI